MTDTESADPYLKRTSKQFRIILILGITALVIGSFGTVRVLIFQDMGALSTEVPWGLWVGLYEYFVLVGTGVVLSFILLRYGVGFKELDKLGPTIVLTGLVALVGALVSIFHDLGQPLRVWRSILTPNFSSVMTWMIWLLLAFLIILVINLWAYRLDRKKTVKSISYISVPVGAILIAVLGSSLSVAAARPLWNDLLLPVIYLISAFAVGSGLVLLLHLIFSPEFDNDSYHKLALQLGRWFISWILIGIFTGLAIVLVMNLTGAIATTNTLREMLTGDFAWTLWILHMGLGVVLPLGLLIWQEFVENFHIRMSLLGYAAGLFVINFIMVPINVVIPGLAFRYDPVTETLLHFEYFPQMIEWMVMVFVIGLMLVIFAMGLHLVCKPFFRLTLQTPLEATEGSYNNEFKNKEQ